MSFYRISLFSFLCFYVALPNVFAHHGGFEPTGQGKESAGMISSAGMINSPTATTLGKNHVSAGFTFEYVRYNSIPADDAHRLHHGDRDVHGKNHEETYDLNVGYGILPDLDLYWVTPIVSKNSIDIHSHASLGQKERATGFGDMRLIGKYRFWKKYVEAALIAGVKFPTGKTDAKQASGNKFEAENQPGTGSWDGEFGIVFSRNFRQRFSTATSFQYFLHGEGAQEHKMGDVFRHNLGVSYSLRQLGKYPNLNLVLEMNTEWGLRDRSRTEKKVYDSGGTTIFLSPGLNASFTQHISVFCTMPIPVYQNLGGEHEEVNFELLSGVNFSF